MPRDTSLTFRRAVFSQQTGEVLLSLVSIEHATLASPIRLVNNLVDITSRGNTFAACGFGLLPPQETSDRLPTSSIWIDNVDQALTESVRSITTPATVTLEIILASDPDRVEAGPFVFRLERIDINAENITGRLAFEDFLNERVPAGRISPTTFPGVFK